MNTESNNIWHKMIGMFFAMAIILTACATPTPTSAPQATATPAQSIIAPTVAPTAGPKKGGKVTMALSQSPGTLNPLLGTQTAISEVTILVVEGLLKTMPDATYAPGLAKEVPSLQNGGVSADGKTITYKLKEGVLWSDGTPFTCDDVKFTWQAIVTPGIGITATGGQTNIDTVECPNATTAIVKLKNFYAPYLTLFSTILPKHYVGDPKDMRNWAYNRKPLGTGPFKIEEWKTDEYVRLVRNEKYREQGKPYLDEVLIRIVPSTDVALQLLGSGEVDIVWNNAEADFPVLEKMKDVKISAPLQIGGERLFLNMAENKDGSDPTKPHPILGDVRVRQAINYGINKQRLIDKLLYGKAKATASELNIGYFDCKNVQPYPFDPDKAKKLLEDAGWKLGADGIRTKDGNKLRLKYSTTSGNKLREDTQVLIIEDMRGIGMELYIENAPSPTVIGNWDAKSPRARGNFDIIMYTSPGGGASPDPHNQMVNLWASWMIPTENNKGGRNYTRFSDPKADEILNKAAAEPDIAKRKEIYCQLVQMTYEQSNMIYLYQRLDMDSYRDRLQGWIENAWSNNGWNAEDWSLK